MSFCQEERQGGEVRKAKALSQDTLSETARIESKYLSRIEMGGCYPSIAVLVT
ncbi:MAG: hypothetical protein PHN84_07600 [Desulfuromonadaceae bacterium]|nr:hypothetical protein [Desulfuromonadaceae bacterium]MDD2855758.1 hypothetical protein [Desulfuromonadaceae bacterium]